MIKKQGKRNKVDDLAQVYMRVRGGRSVDVTVMIDLTVNPLDFEALFDDLWNFFANEHQYFKDYPEIYEKIKEKRPPELNTLAKLDLSDKPDLEVQRDIKKDALSVFE